MFGQRKRRACIPTKMKGTAQVFYIEVNWVMDRRLGTWGELEWHFPRIRAAVMSLVIEFTTESQQVY